MKHFTDFQSWDQLSEAGHFQYRSADGQSAEKKFCRMHNLELKQLKEMKELIRELTEVRRRSAFAGGGGVLCISKLHPHLLPTFEIHFFPSVLRCGRRSRINHPAPPTGKIVEFMIQSDAILHFFLPLFKFFNLKQKNTEINNAF